MYFATFVLFLKSSEDQFFHFLCVYLIERQFLVVPHTSPANHVSSRLMDTYFMHPPILVFANNTCISRIYFFVLDTILYALAFQQRDKLFPYKITLLSLPLTTTHLVLGKLQVLKDNTLT